MSEGRLIVICDDDPQVAALLRRSLEGAGYRTCVVGEGEGLRRALRTKAADLVVLDLMLPGEDGLVLLREIRDRHDLPVVILTGRGEALDRVIGLELGADDYLGKPFEPRELVARVRSVLRRSGGGERRRPEEAAERLRFEGWTLDLLARELTAADGTPVPLTAAEFDLLTEFARRPGRVLSRDQLLELARRRSGTPYDRSIDVHVMNLRRKIEADARNPQLIKTVYGAGYIFTAAPERG